MKTETGPCGTMPALSLHFQNLAILGPLVLAADLFLFLRSEVIGNVKGLTDLLGGFALDHVGDSFASHIKERFDVEVVGRLVAG
jgi:hypothetical protein